MVDGYSEKIFYNFIRQSPEYIQYVRPEFFDDEYLKFCFQIDAKFYRKYKKLPSKKQLIILLKQTKNEKFFIQHTNEDEPVFNLSLIDRIFEDISEYDLDWLENNVKAWIQYKNLNLSLFQSIKYLKTSSINLENIQNVVDKVKNSIFHHNSIDFSNSEVLDFYNPENYKINQEATFTTGYAWLDGLLNGGWQEKTLHCFAGPVKGGKSILLANLTCNAVKNGINSAVITLELQDKKFLKRIAVNLFDVPIHQYDNFIKDENRVKEAISKFREFSGSTLKRPGLLFIKEYPTSTASTLDIETFLVKLEMQKQIKLRLILIDYINIMKNWRNPNSENTYLKIKQIAEDLRAMAVRNNWCIVTVTQLTRSGMVSSSLNITDIAESIGLSHTVDSLFGIIQDPIDRETGKISLKALALRESGGIGQKKVFLIDYDYMRIIEDDTLNLQANYDSLFT